MSRSATVLVIALTSAVLAQAQAARGAGQDAVTSHPGCETSPVTMTFSFVGPVAGEDRVWIADGHFGRWQAGPTKTLWIVPRDLRAPVTITGRRLDGDGVLEFQLDRGTPPAPEIRFDPGVEGGVHPDGATPDQIERFLFQPSYLYYPSPGCWEIAIASPSGTERLVVRQE